MEHLEREEFRIRLPLRSTLAFQPRKFRLFTCGVAEYRKLEKAAPMPPTTTFSFTSSLTPIAVGVRDLRKLMRHQLSRCWRLDIDAREAVLATHRSRVWRALPRFST